MATSSENDARLQEVLAALIEAEERGETIDLKVWTERYPDCAAELTDFWQKRAEFEEVAGRRALASGVLAPTISAEPAAVGPGSRLRYFGDYELLEEIARGGMGVVYRAKQRTLNREVALKMILAGQFADQAEVQRFRREAEAAAALDHPNIVPIYEVGEHEGQQYFTMQLVEGGSLAKALERPEWKPGNQDQQRRAAELVATLARAVHHAHQRGILHRDLKPGNVLLQTAAAAQTPSDGRHQRGDQAAAPAALSPKLTDFGLAKRTGGAKDEFTRTGAIIGTPAYMAPEQAQATKQLTTAADVYSLGALLYTILTGRPPFQGKSTYETILQVIEAEPSPPRQVQPTVDADLATICMKCLRKEPGQRYASAEALAEELERWSKGEPIQARPVSTLERFWRWRRRNPVVFALAGALGLAVLAGVVSMAMALWRIAEERDRGTQRLARNYVEKGLKEIDDEQLVGALPWFAEALKIDGNHPARTPMHEHRLAAVLRRMPRVVHFWPGVKLAQFRPGSQQLATARENRLEQWNWPGGQPLGEPFFVPDETKDGVVNMAYSSDGKYLVALSKSHFAVLHAETGNPLYPPVPLPKLEMSWGNFRPCVLNVDTNRLVMQVIETINREVYLYRLQAYGLTTGRPVGQEFRHQTFDLGEALASPCGRFVVTTNSDGKGLNERYNLILWELGTGKVRWRQSMSSSNSTYANVVAFRSDGNRLVAGHGQELALFDVATGTKLHSVPQASQRGDRSLWNLTWNADGTRIAAGFSNNSVDLLNAEDLRLVEGKTLDHGAYPTFSPKRPRLYTLRWGTASDSRSRGSVKQWGAVDATSKPAEFHLTDYAGTLFFSGDEELVGVYGGRFVQVFAAADGTAQTPPLPHAAVASAELSADGRWLLTAGAGARLWDLAAGIDELESLPGSAGDPAVDADFSRYGSTVVTLHPQGRLEIWDQKSQTNRWFKVDASFRQIQLSPTGRHLLLLRHQPRADGPKQDRTVMNEVQILEVSTGRLLLPQPLRFLEVAKIGFTPDGQHALVIDREAPHEVGVASSYIHRVELPQGRLLDSLKVEHRYVEQISLSEDGKWLALASQTIQPDSTPNAPRYMNEVQVRAVSGLSNPSFAQRVGGAVEELEFSPDGTVLAVTMKDTPLELWNWRTKVKLAGDFRHPTPSPEHPFEYPDRVAFSPDGKSLATGVSGSIRGGGNCFRLWDLTTGQPKTPFLQHGSYIATMAFRQDGEIIAVSGRGNLTLYETSTGLPLGPSVDCPHHQAIGWDREGRSLFVSVYWNQNEPDASVRRWWLPRLKVPAATWQATAEFLSLSGIDATGGLGPLSEMALAAAWSQSADLIRGGATRPEETETRRLSTWRHARRSLAFGHRDWENALVFNSLLLAESPGSWKNHALQGQLFAALGRFPKAELELTRALELGAALETRLRRGEVRAELGEWPKAFADLGPPWPREGYAGHLDAIRAGYAAGAFDAVRDLLHARLKEDDQLKYALHESLLLYSVLLPTPPMALEGLLAWSAKNIADGIGNVDRRFLHAMALARAGRKNEALDALRETEGKLEEAKDDARIMPLAWAARAYVNAQLGRKNEAAKALDAIPRATRPRPPWDALESPSGYDAGSWSQLAELEAIRQAAERILKEKTLEQSGQGRD